MSALIPSGCQYHPHSFKRNPTVHAVPGPPAGLSRNGPHVSIFQSTQAGASELKWGFSHADLGCLSNICTLTPQVCSRGLRLCISEGLPGTILGVPIVQGVKRCRPGAVVLTVGFYDQHPLNLVRVTSQAQKFKGGTNSLFNMPSRQF